MKIDCNKITTLRTTRHWTQEDLAAASGLSGRTVQRVEKNGRSSLETARALAAAFDVSVDDFTNATQKVEAGLQVDEKPRSIIRFWAIIVICLLIGTGVFSYPWAIHEDLLSKVYIAWLIARGLIILVMLQLVPVFLTFAIWNVVKRKFELAQRYLILSLCSFVGFFICGSLVSGHTLQYQMQNLSGVLLFSYLVFYASLYGGVEVIKGNVVK